MPTLDQLLPSEVIFLILSCLPRRRDLAAFCLASKTCHGLGFSQLYETLYLGQASHIDRLILRIANEHEVQTKLRIAPCVRELVFDDERYLPALDREQLICEDVATRLAVGVVPHLTELESVAWKSHWLPRNTRIFKALRVSCPKLRSLEILNQLYVINDEQTSWTSALYAFKRLKNLSLTCRNIALGRRGIPLPIISLIQSSPNLESLDLTFQGTTIWSPNKLLEAIDKPLENLHTVKFDGHLSNNWPTLFDRPSALLTFFESHPQLHTIRLGWTPALGAKEYTFEPDTVARLFPALEHFEGPAFLCLPIVMSRLSAQLQSMRILDLSNPPSGSVETLCELAARAVILPSLRVFEFQVDPKARLGAIVDNLTRAAPELRELSMREASLSQLGITENLHAPNLFRLIVKAGVVTPPVLRALAGACPKLEEVFDTYNASTVRGWRVGRRVDGSAELKALPEHWLD